LKKGRGDKIMKAKLEREKKTQKLILHKWRGREYKI
jgi:hypothetical protein